MRSKVFISLLIISTNLVKAQNETNKWFLKWQCGLDFSTTPPSPFYTNTGMHAMAGSSSISDANGNALFYTDGDTIWNANNQIMANGAGLNGNPYCTQSALIIKKPGSNSIYYVFSQNGFYGNAGASIQFGLRYALVDMTLAAGQGSVIAKNIIVDTTASVQKLAATTHCNQQDVWILTHDYNTSDFKAYLLTSNGLSQTPVISTIGQNGHNSTTGVMKFSPNGKKLGYTALNNHEIYDFNNSSGLVSNYLKLNPSVFIASGCEFSSDGTKFYGSTMEALGLTSKIQQWNLCAGTDADILASCTTFTLPYTDFKEMQLARDGKIYIGGAYHNVGDGLWIIDQPNSYGVSCNLYMDTLLYINLTANFGLPNFNSSFFNPSNATPVFSIQAEVNCGLVNFNFSQSNPNYGCTYSGNRIDAATWDFGDPASGANNSSSLLDAFHHYSSLGSYTATAFITHDCKIDTLKTTVTINHLNPPQLTVSGTQNICIKETASISVSGANSYLWSNGSAGNSLTLSPSYTSTYSVIGTDTLTNCYSTKSFTVHVSNCVGVKELNLLHTQAYPNPVTTEFTIQRENDEIFEVLIFDGLARKIKHIKNCSRTVQIDMSTLPPACYYCQIRSSSGQNTFKLIKSEL